MFKRTSRLGAVKSDLGEINWKRENSIYKLDNVNKPPEMWRSSDHGLNDQITLLS